jgi:hypothetical protein
MSADFEALEPDVRAALRELRGEPSEATPARWDAIAAEAAAMRAHPDDRPDAATMPARGSVGRVVLAALSVAATLLLIATLVIRSREETLVLTTPTTTTPTSTTPPDSTGIFPWMTHTKLLLYDGKGSVNVIEPDRGLGRRVVLDASPGDYPFPFVRVGDRFVFPLEGSTRSLPLDLQGTPTVLGPSTLFVPSLDSDDVWLMALGPDNGYETTHPTFTWTRVAVDGSRTDFTGIESSVQFASHDRLWVQDGGAGLSEVDPATRERRPVSSGYCTVVVPSRNHVASVGTKDPACDPVHVLTAGDGAIRDVHPDITQELSLVASPDGTRAAAIGRSSLDVVDLATGHVEQLPLEGAATYGKLVWSPDSTQVFVQTTSPQQTMLRGYNLATGEHASIPFDLGDTLVAVDALPEDQGPIIDAPTDASPECLPVLTVGGRGVNSTSRPVLPDVTCRIVLDPATSAFVSETDGASMSFRRPRSWTSRVLTEMELGTASTLYELSDQEMAPPCEIPLSGTFSCPEPIERLDPDSTFVQISRDPNFFGTDFSTRPGEPTHVGDRSAKVDRSLSPRCAAVGAARSVTFYVRATTIPSNQEVIIVYACAGAGAADFDQSVGVLLGTMQFVDQP